jgi:hypothetical protein
MGNSKFPNSTQQIFNPHFLVGMMQLSTMCVDWCGVDALEVETCFQKKKKAVSTTIHPLLSLQ